MFDLRSVASSELFWNVYSFWWRHIHYNEKKSSRAATIKDCLHLTYPHSPSSCMYGCSEHACNLWQHTIFW